MRIFLGVSKTFYILDRNFADDIFKYIFVTENSFNLTQLLKKQMQAKFTIYFNCSKAALDEYEKKIVKQNIFIHCNMLNCSFRLTIFC